MTVSTGLYTREVAYAILRYVQLRVIVRYPLKMASNRLYDASVALNSDSADWLIG